MTTKKKTEEMKPADFSHLMNNPEIEEEGITWEDADSPIWITIAHRNAPSIERFHSRLLMKEAVLIGTGSPEAVRYTEKCETMALARCIRDWGGVPNPDDLSKTFAHSFDNAVALLSHPKWRKLRRVVAAIARNDERFNTPESAAEAAAGN